MLEIRMVFQQRVRGAFLAQEHTGLHSLNADYGLQKYIMESLGKFLVITEVGNCRCTTIMSILHVVNLLSRGFYMNFLPGVYILVVYNYTSNKL